jgi:hypothetical protein
VVDDPGFISNRDHTAKKERQYQQYLVRLIYQFMHVVQPLKSIY